jgi:5-methylthioribose kinase
MELLSEETVGAYLVERRLVPAGARLRVAPLAHGVSNVVLAVEADGFAAVVKQALPRLAVAEEWLAKRERTLTEAAGLELAGRLTPGAVPRVLDVDEERCAAAVELAPPALRNWKLELLEGRCDPEVAARLGELLGAWHRGTEHDPAIAARFGDGEAFEQLRVDPYHRTVMRRRPALARAVGELVEEMLDTHACLVHGDFSPKNVLAGGGTVWVLDFEVAHCGDPVFDLAFMLNHLLLKAIHRPGSLAGYRSCAEAFLSAYGREAHPEYLLGHTGALMVARVDGKSPAEYLTEPERLAARALGSRLLLDPPASVGGAWDRLAEGVR